MKMPKQLKSKWVNALLSGKYAQTQGCLMNNGAYCCLGVLEEVAEGAVEMEPFVGGGASRHSEKLPSIAFLERNGIDDPATTEYARGTIRALAQLNDGGKSFEFIAGYIEASVEGVEEEDKTITNDEMDGG